MLRATVLLLLALLPLVSPQLISDGHGPSMPTFIVTSPNKAKFDTSTTFSVSATNLAQPETVHLLLQTGDSSHIRLNETVLRFTSDGVQTWSVVIDSDRMTEHLQRSVQLVASYASLVKVMTIFMNPLSGFIMIQTDKLIYTPRQTVMYRIIALDDDLKFSQWPLTVDIMNPQMIIVERQHHASADAFVGKNFSLPRDTTQGNWSISATYKGSKSQVVTDICLAYYDSETSRRFVVIVQVRTTKTLKFEVKEYVLPTFKVQVEAEEKVIASTTDYILVKVKAMYSYGEPVQGTVRLRLGSIENDRVLLFNQTYTGTLSGGEWSKAVPVRDMRSHRVWFPDGSPLYLTANVTEAGTGEVGTAVDLSSVFKNPVISFDSSKRFFRPGFEYTLAVSVKFSNNDPVYVIIQIKNSQGGLLQGGLDGYLALDAHGKLNHPFPVPAEAVSLVMAIQVPVDFNTPPFREDFTANKFNSPTDTYLHLGQDSNGIILRYTPAPQLSLGPQELITVLILSKGRMIHNESLPRDSSGQTLLPLSRDLLVRAAPVARAVAYFYVGGNNSEIVSDSLYIDTEHVCREELSLFHGSHGHGGQVPLLPKQRTEVDVEGGAGMRVGLLAVDKAVYFLRDEQALTRDKIFSMLADADTGRGIGDGGDTEEIFEFAGLNYVKLTESYEPTLPLDGDFTNHGRFNAFFLNSRLGNGMHLEVYPDEESIPLENVRRFFPESWLFKEMTLPQSGFGSEYVTLPDSITTWSLTAVGVGAAGGVCMSSPLDIRVFKPFFARVRLPYKAVRLEEVSVEVGVYNHQPFDINVTVTVRGEEGLCFSEGFGGQQQIRYRATVQAGQTNSESIRVIPLVAGSSKLTVDVRSTNGLVRDTVEHTLHTVAEGRKVEKTITFPLDPSGKHSSHNAPDRNGVRRSTTATITNRILTKDQKQLTHVDLFMPKEAVRGSAQCDISACGDLIGDLISTTVVDGDALFRDSVVDAEDAIGNLAPVVHALLYLNRSHIMTSEVQDKGKALVTYGVSRLLSYRKEANNLVGSFALTPDSPSATWLTALVLKTLCHAEEITFIDHENLVSAGVRWLLGQINTNGTLAELDTRLARPSLEYDIMLSAETMIALHECKFTRPLTDADLELMVHLEDLLGGWVRDVTSPLVMAKTAYALTLSNPLGDVTVAAVQRLKDMRRATPEGLSYWSEASEAEPPQRPFWYHSGTNASTVEATAYALLVFSKQAEGEADYEDEDEEGFEEDEDYAAPEWNVNLDAIAAWLIQKRNSRGVFIGALDTAAATQALSVYSLARHGHDDVNLRCDVTTRPTRDYTHTFNFTEEDAITPKSLSNVPVGRQIHIDTRGTGLGQMKVRIAYNVPVAPNADCRYRVNITTHTATYTTRRRTGDDVCRYCNMGCDTDNDPSSSNDGANLNRRFKRQRITASRVNICLQVCLRSTGDTAADRTLLSVQMLSGFQPIKQDLDRLHAQRDVYSLSSLVWVDEKESVEMKFNQIPADRDTCVSFRAIERRDVARRNPALVTVRRHDEAEPQCAQTYDPVVSEVNLAVYCANSDHHNQGQCRCFSGHCGACHTSSADVDLNHIQNLVCQSEYIHKIRQTNISESDDWFDITAEVLSTEKNGTEAVGAELDLVTPLTCTCPRSMPIGPYYFFGSHVDTFVDRNNGKSKTYLLDQTTSFLTPSLGTSDADRTGNWIRMAARARCPN